MKPDYAKKIYTLDDDDLERLIDDWIARASSGYKGSERFSGSGDMGRDVVGYKTNQKHEGEWDNFQCKQLKSVLYRPDALRELGKIFFHSSKGNFILPVHYFFVAPRGVARTVKELVAHPTKLAEALETDWDEICADHIETDTKHVLNDNLRALIRSYKFENVEVFDANRLVKQASMTAVLVDWFGADPGQYPEGEAPEDIQPEEQVYINELAIACGDRRGNQYGNVSEALNCSEYGPRLRLHRKRYFEAARFKRYYRDNTPTDVLRSFEDDIYYGVIETHQAKHPDVLGKVDAVMVRASAVQVSGVLGKYARVSVKQGTCHHFSNDGILPWQ